MKEFDLNNKEDLILTDFSYPPGQAGKLELEAHYECREDEKSHTGSISIILHRNGKAFETVEIKDDLERIRKFWKVLNLLAHSIRI